MEWNELYKELGHVRKEGRQSPKIRKGVDKGSIYSNKED